MTFHGGNRKDGKHYWLTPPDLSKQLEDEFGKMFDPCPFPKPLQFDGLTCDWGKTNYVNPPFGSIFHEGRKKGHTAWARRAILEQKRGNDTIFVYPVAKWVLMMIEASIEVRNLGDVRWHSTEDGLPGPGVGQHIAMFVLKGE